MNRTSGNAKTHFCSGKCQHKFQNEKTVTLIRQYPYSIIFYVSAEQLEQLNKISKGKRSEYLRKLIDKDIHTNKE